MSLSGEPKALTDADTKAAFGAVEGTQYESTYKRLFKKFTRDINRVSEAVSDKDPQFVHMAIDDVKSTHTNNKIRGGSTPLENLSTDVQTNLDHLKTIADKGNKAAKQNYETLFQKYSPWKNDADKSGTERKKLQQELGEYITTMRTTFSEVLQAIKDKKPEREIAALFARIEEEQKKLDVKITKLEKDEGTLDGNLKLLLKQSHEALTALASTGAIPHEQLKQLKS